MDGDESIPSFTPSILVGDISNEYEEEYLKWTAKHGIWLAKTTNYPSYTEDGVRGVVATDNIYAGEDLIRVPENLMVNMRTIMRDPTLKKAIETIPGLLDTDEDAAIALWVTYHRCVLKEASPYWEYVRILPDLDLLSDWSEEELIELGMEDKIETVHNRRARFNSIACTVVEILNEKLPDAFPSDSFTVPWYTWAYKQVSARGFGSRLSFVTMVPLADCFNHSNVSSAYTLDSLNGETPEDRAPDWDTAGDPESSYSTSDTDDVDSVNDLSRTNTPLSRRSRATESYFRIRVFPRPPALEVQAATSDAATTSDDDDGSASIASEGSMSDPGAPGDTREIVFSAGEEVTISYGNKNNFNLLLDYGFPLDYNPNESYRLPIPRWRSIYPSGMAPSDMSLHVQKLVGSAQIPLPLMYNRWPELSLTTFRQWAFGQMDNGRQLMEAWKAGRIKSFREPFHRDLCNPLDVDRNALLLFLRFLHVLAQGEKGEYVLAALKQRMHWKHASLLLEKRAEQKRIEEGSSSDSSDGSLLVYLDSNVYSVARRRVLERMQNGDRKRTPKEKDLEDPINLFGFSDIEEDESITQVAVSTAADVEQPEVPETHYVPYEDNIPIRFLLCLRYRATRYNLVLSHMAYASFVMAVLEYYQVTAQRDGYDPSKSIFWQIIDSKSMKTILVKPLESNSETKAHLQRNRNLFYGCKSIVEIVRTTKPIHDLADTTSTNTSTTLDYYYPLPDNSDVPHSPPPGIDVHPTTIAIGAGYVAALYLLFGSEYVSSLYTPVSSTHNALTPVTGIMKKKKRDTIAAIVANYATTGDVPTAALEFVSSVVRSVPELTW